MTAYKDILFIIKDKFRFSSLYAEHCAKHLKSCMFFLGMLLSWYYFYSQKAKHVTVLKYNFTDFSQCMSIYTHIEAHSDFILSQLAYFPSWFVTFQNKYFVNISPCY